MHTPTLAQIFRTFSGLRRCRQLVAPEPSRCRSSMFWNSGLSRKERSRNREHRFAYTVSTLDWKQGKRFTDIWLTDAAGGRSRQMTFTPDKDEFSPLYHPVANGWHSSRIAKRLRRRTDPRTWPPVPGAGQLFPDARRRRRGPAYRCGRSPRCVVRLQPRRAQDRLHGRPRRTPASCTSSTSTSGTESTLTKHAAGVGAICLGRPTVRVSGSPARIWWIQTSRSAWT